MHILQGIALFYFFIKQPCGERDVSPSSCEVSTKRRDQAFVSRREVVGSPLLEDCGPGFAYRQQSILEEVVKEPDIPVQRFYCRRRREEWRMKKVLA